MTSGNGPHLQIIDESSIDIKNNRLESNYTNLKNDNLVNYDNELENANPTFVRQKTRIIKNVTKKTTKMLPSFGILLQKMLKLQPEASKASNSFLMPILQKTGENNFVSSIVDFYKQQATISPELGPKNTSKLNGEQTIEDLVIESNPDNTNDGNILNKQKTLTKIKGWNLFKDSVISNNYGSSFIGRKNPTDTNEIKVLRKEYILYKNTVEYLSEEISYLKSYKSEMNKVILDFQHDQEILYKSQVDNYTKALQILKSSCQEEMKTEKAKIVELTNIIDDMIIK